MKYLLDFRMSDVGGAVVPGRVMQMQLEGEKLGSEEHLRRESHITFLVHGYNVSRNEGKLALQRLANALSKAGYTQALALVLWPGDNRHLGFASYPVEGRDADDSAQELVRFIERIVPSTTKLSFLAHSLGTRVVMQVLSRLNSRYQIGQVCLMAAAIDDFSLADPRAYRYAVVRSERVAVLASHNDLVLRNAYPLGDFLEQFLYSDQQWGHALGFHGPVPAHAFAVPTHVYHVQIPDIRGVGHHDYLPDPQPTSKQQAAVGFADLVLQGNAAPQYL